MSNQPYNRKLRQKMNEHAMSIADLAKACGLSTRTINNMLNRKHNAQAKNVRKVCALFRCMPLQIGLCDEPTEATV